MGEGSKGRKGRRDPNKPSSLRGRVDRARRTYQRKSNPTPLIIGAVVIVVLGGGMYFVLNTEPKRTVAPSSGSQRKTEPRPGPSAPIKPVKKKPEDAGDLVFKARTKRKFGTRDPEAALKILEDGLEKWGDVPDVHHEMAMAVNDMIPKARNDPEAVSRLRKEKLAHLEKAMELLESGKKWNVDPRGNRTGNLKTSIEQARLRAGE